MTDGSRAEWSMGPGQALGPWRVVAPLGLGSFAEVYKAQHYLNARRLAAIKVLRPGRLESGEIRRRFLQEADCLSEIDNFNVVKFYDVDQTPDGRIWMAMEYLVGQSLYEVLAQAGSLEITRALTIAADIADGVQAAHAIGLIHRDLKEENIFITTTGTVKVLDFGVAKLKNPELSARAKSTVANGVIGTLTHLAPEQIDGCGACVESDVYALGVILYTLITGRHPFLRPGEEGDDARNIALRILVSTPQPPHILAPGVTPEIEFVLLTALAKRPEHRYPSMVDFNRAIVSARHNYEQGIRPPAYTAAALQEVTARASFQEKASVPASYEQDAKPVTPPAGAGAPPMPAWLWAATALTVAVAAALVIRPEWAVTIRHTLRLAPATATSAMPAASVVPGLAAPDRTNITPAKAPGAASANAPADVGAAVDMGDGVRAAASAQDRSPAKTSAPAPVMLHPTVPDELKPTPASAQNPVAKATAKPSAAPTSAPRPTSGIVDPWADGPSGR